MSRWTEQFKANPFLVDWSRLVELIGDPLGTEDEATVAVAQEYARLRKVVEYVAGIVGNLDPELLPQNYLGNMQPYVQQTINEITAYKSNANVGHLLNANANADQFLALSLQSPFVALGTTKANLTRAATAYGETIDRHAETYAARSDQLVTDSAQKLKDVEDQAAEATEEVTKLEAKIVNVENTVQGQLSAFNSTFQSSEAARAATFDAWLTKFQDKAIDDYSQVIEQNSAGLLAMQSFQDDAERVLGTVIDTAQAGAYAKYASEEKQSANWFRRLALASMIAAALVLFVPEAIQWIRQGASYTLDWRLALYRLPFSLVLFAPALYLARESSRHRTNEVINRRRQHILTTIGPYLALLPKEKADVIKADVAKNIFSENLPTFEDKSPDPGTIAMQFSQLLTTLTKK